MKRVGRLRELVIILVGAVLLSCESTPQWPEDNSFGWKTYENTNFGYTMEYPDNLTYREHRGGTIFRFDGEPILVVNFVNKKEGDDRGLWPGHEVVGQIELGGREGEKFNYEHCDGPFCMHTLSYVVPHRDKYIGVEFRMEADEPGPVQQRILASFQFIE